MFPKARRKLLLLQEVGDELVVYDQTLHRAHRLNATAAATWHHCDGETSVAALASRLREELNVPADEDLVRVALDRLWRAHLLQDPKVPASAGISRRALVKKLGILAALLPMVTSLSAPTPVMAQYGCCNCSDEEGGCDPDPGGNECKGTHSLVELLIVEADGDSREKCFANLKTKAMEDCHALCQELSCIHPLSESCLASDFKYELFVYNRFKKKCNLVITACKCGCFA